MNYSDLSPTESQTDRANIEIPALRFFAKAFPSKPLSRLEAAVETLIAARAVRNARAESRKAADKIPASPARIPAEPLQAPQWPLSKGRASLALKDYDASYHPVHPSIKLEAKIWGNVKDCSFLTLPEIKMFKQLGCSFSGSGYDLYVEYTVNFSGRNDLWAPFNYAFGLYGNQRTITIQTPSGLENSIKLCGRERLSGVFNGRRFKIEHFGRGSGSDTSGPAVIIHWQRAITPLQKESYFNITAPVRLKPTMHGVISIHALVPPNIYAEISANNFGRLENMVKTVLPGPLIAYLETKPAIYDESADLEKRSIFTAPRMIVKVA